MCFLRLLLHRSFRPSSPLRLPHLKYLLCYVVTDYATVESECLENLGCPHGASQPGFGASGLSTEGQQGANRSAGVAADGRGEVLATDSDSCCESGDI